MSITAYFSQIDSSKPYEPNRRATVFTHNNGTSLTVGYQNPSPVHSGERIFPDIYPGIGPSGN